MTRFVTAYGLALVGAIAILIMGWMAARWAERAARRFAERSEHVGPTLAPMLSKIARLTVLSLVIIAALDKLGVDTTSMLAALGALGLGVGLALKDTLADIAAGVVLLVLRPFEAGDDVDINGVEGKVISIDVFETKLTGFDGVPTVLPNKKVREGTIRNYSKAEKRRFDLTVGIAYEANVDEAIAAILALLDEDERVFDTPPPIVNAVDLADSSVNILVRFWIEPVGSFAVQLDVRRKIKLALDTSGITIPFPQRDIRIVERKTA